MTDDTETRRLLFQAVEASGLSDRAFAKDKLGVDERTFRRWKAGATIPKSKHALIGAVSRDVAHRRASK